MHATLERWGERGPWLAGLVVIGLAPVLPRQASGAPKYFGYYGSHTISSGCTGDACTDELSDHTNVIAVNSHADPGPRISYAAAKGMGAIVAIGNAFFLPSWPQPHRDYGKLKGSGCQGFDCDRNGKPDYEDGWIAVAERLRPHQAHIVALDILDEPFWNLAIARSVFRPANSAGVITPTELAANLELAARLVKSTFPKIPIGLNFATPELVPGHPAEMPRMPAGYDWVSFDCYNSFARCAAPGLPELGGTPTMAFSIPEYVDKLKRRMLPGQRLVLIPDGQLFPGVPVNANQINRKVKIADKYYREFIENGKEPLLIGVFPYLYSSYQDGCASSTCTYHGTQDLPALRAKYREIGREIIARPEMALDAPAPGATVMRRFTVAGWALNRSALSGAGIDAVDVWAYPNPGSGVEPIYLGPATLGASRPDVARAFGNPQFANSGFVFTGTLPEPGVYDLVVFARTLIARVWTSRVARVTVKLSDPQMNVDGPGAGEIIQTSFHVGGWAIDRGALKGTGIDAVDVWAYPRTGSKAEPIYAGPATLGVNRPDIAKIFGAQFAAAGFDLTGTLRPGVYDLVVYARSSVTSSWDHRVVRVKVASPPARVAAAATRSPTSGRGADDDARTGRKPSPSGATASPTLAAAASSETASAGAATPRAGATAARGKAPGSAPGSATGFGRRLQSESALRPPPNPTLASEAGDSLSSCSPETPVPGSRYGRGVTRVGQLKRIARPLARRYEPLAGWVREELARTQGLSIPGKKPACLAPGADLAYVMNASLAALGKRCSDKDWAKEWTREGLALTWEGLAETKEVFEHCGVEAVRGDCAECRPKG